MKKLLLLTLFVSFSALADVKLSECTIISPVRPHGYEIDAVEEAVCQLSKVVKKTLPVVKEGGVAATAGKIYIGDTQAAKAAGIDCSALGREGFRIVCRGNDIYIAGKTATGTLYGVYEFAQRCGAWQVSPDAEYIEVNPDFMVRNIDLTMNPAIRRRGLYHEGYFWNTKEGFRRWFLFDKRNRIFCSEAGHPLTRNQEKTDIDPAFQVSKAISAVPVHTFFKYVPPETYFADYPEYYAMNRDGVRICKPQGQLCFTNPQVSRIILERLKKDIAADREKYPGNYPLVYDLSQEDGCYYLCHCPECRKIVKKYGNETGLLLWFINGIADEIGKDYPDVFIRTFIYVNTEAPPTGIIPAKNVLTQMTDLYSKCNHLLPLEHPANLPRYKLIDFWAKNSRQMMLWDYMLGDGTEPNTPADAIIADAKYFGRIRLSWINMESEIRPMRSEAFFDLKNFLLAQLWFNPEQDTEKLISVFFKGYYGSAAKEMLAYHEFVRSSQRKNPTTNMQDWHMRELKHLSVEFLEECKALLAKAYAKADSDLVRIHILREINVADYALTKFYQRMPDKRDALNALLKEYAANCLRVIDSYELLESRKEVYRKKIREQLDAHSVSFELPPVLANIPREKMILLAHPQISFAGGVHGRKIKDPDSVMPLSGVWSHSDPRKFSTQIAIGTYDWKTKKNCNLNLACTAKDEKYHWFNLGIIELGPQSLIWLQDWHLSVALKSFYILSDGAEKNSNRYELWISCKVQGPVYVPGSTKENAICIDRLVMVSEDAAIGENSKVIAVNNDNSFDAELGMYWGKNGDVMRSRPGAEVSKAPGRFGEGIRVTNNETGIGVFYATRAVKVNALTDTLKITIHVKGNGKFRIGCYGYTAKGGYCCSHAPEWATVDSPDWSAREFELPLAPMGEKTAQIRLFFDVRGKADLTFDDLSVTKESK